jgi:hypothetical protein
MSLGGQGLQGGQEYEVSGTVEATPAEPEQAQPEQTEETKSEEEPVAPEETQPETSEESTESTDTEQSGSGGSALEKEVQLAKDARDEGEEAAVAQNEASAKASAAHREAYEGSDQQAVHEQIKDAEAAMRGDNTQIGNPGDPTRGPSS